MLKRQTVSLVKKNASHQRDDCIKKNCWRFKNYLIFQHGKFIWKFAFNNFHQIFVNDWLHILIQIIPVTEISIIICWTNKLECHTECKKRPFIWFPHHQSITSLCQHGIFSTMCSNSQKNPFEWIGSSSDAQNLRIRWIHCTN